MQEIAQKGKKKKKSTVTFIQWMIGMYGVIGCLTHDLGQVLKLPELRLSTKVD